MVILLDERQSGSSGSIMEKGVELKHVEEVAGGWEPEDFLVTSEKLSGKSLLLLKQLYDLTKSTEKDVVASGSIQRLLPSGGGGESKTKKKKKGKKQLFSKTEVPLLSLITENFDHDQIWEEIQLQNTLIYDSLVSSISKVLAYKPRVKKRVEEDKSEEDEQGILKELEGYGEGPEDEDDLSDFFENDDKYRKMKQKGGTSNYAKSVVDDKFFNLAQMTEFLEKVEGQQEEDENRDEEDEDIDYFKDEEGEEEEEAPEYFYNDFFDPPLQAGSKSTTNEENVGEQGQGSDDEDAQHGLSRELQERKDDENEMEDEEEESEEEETVLSNFERRRRKIEENIQEMEDEALKPKSWQLTGEVTAQTRPENSLLEEHLIYEHLVRQAPEITMQTTQKLEDIIKDRIKDQAWDDVIRKIKPIEDVSEYKKRLVLDAEKSKMSLAEIYEKEYVEKHQQSTEATEEERDPEEHLKIKSAMQSLFAKLDALSHFNYSPKAPVPEVKTIRNAPATSVEEITPSTYSDATMLAPQEILAPAKGEIIGKEERSSTDKKRERRLKKKKQHLKRLAKEEKARGRGLGLRNIKLAESVVKKSKRNGTDDTAVRNKELKSSKAFFAKLQEQVTSHIDKVAKRKNSTKSKSELSAKKFKL